MRICWSTGLLSREFVTYYSNSLYGTTILPEPEPLTVHYADYAAWQHQLEKSGHLEHQLQWWTSQLEGIPTLLEMPTDHPRPKHASGVGAVMSLPISAQTGSALTSLC